MKNRRLMNQINVVPYIDVMLVLLVIFMVTAPMIQMGNIELPTVSEMPAPPAEAMRVILRTDGSMALQRAGNRPEELMPRGDLMISLQEVLAANPDQSFVIAADKALDYGQVTDMLDWLRQAGVRKVGLQTEGRHGQ